MLRLQIVTKLVGAYNEPDAYFEERTREFETLDAQLKKLHAALEGLVAHRRGLCVLFLSLFS